MSELAKITELILQLEQQKPIRESDWTANIDLPYQTVGLVLRAGLLTWPKGIDLLNTEIINAALDKDNRHLDLHIHKCIASTNTLLVQEAQTASIDNRVCAAEFQYQGRGRRGRQWLSPYARNLAVSLGRASARNLSDLGGLSLVVGLALAEALETAGVVGVALKWPNDLWVKNKKLAGILVELVSSKQGTQVIIGFGVNVDLSNAEVRSIDQPVTDVRRCGSLVKRSMLLAACLNALNRYLRHFEENGFSPFISTFDTLHALQGKDCNLISAGRASDRPVKVLGVGETGELIVESARGKERIHGGEVSIRPK